MRSQWRVTHHNAARSTLEGIDTEAARAVTKRMEEVVGPDGRQTIEAFWKEVPPEEGLFRDPIAALEGGVAKQGGGDVIPPPECARLDAASVARITRETAKTRREILEAHREALREARKGRER